jgi:hypothetical protein
MTPIRGFLRWLLYLASATIVAFATVAVINAPSRLVNNTPPVTLDGDPDLWLAQREAAVNARTPIIPGTEKRIRWINRVSRDRTGYAIVYLHGFSASRREIAPVPEQIAIQLGANLFETRLAGHGLRNAPLSGVTAEDWLADAAEALAIGNAIGQSIVVVATSTGATLALAMAGHKEMQNVSTIVMISPNFAARDSNSEFLTWPGGPMTARLVIGTTRCWVPLNDAQAQFWSTCYPIAAAVEMMRLVKYTRSLLPMSLDVDLLTLFSFDDTVVSPQATVAGLAKISSRRNEQVEVLHSTDPDHHVLLGDILSPETTAEYVAAIVAFVTAN